MTVTISKPAINIREKLTEASAVVPYEQRQFHFDNLVTNGTFDAGTSGWTFEATATDTSTAGFLSGTTGGAANRLAHQTITTVVGKAYRVDIVTGPASTAVYVGAAPSALTNGTTGFVTSGSATLTFVATVSTTYLSVMSVGASANASLDSISVYASDGTDVAFAMPKGWKPLHVYDDGVLQREGSAEDYEVTFDGFHYYVKPTVPNPGARNTVIGVRA